MSENSGSLGLSMSLRQNIAEQTRAASQGVEQLNKTFTEAQSAAQLMADKWSILATRLRADGKSLDDIGAGLKALGATTREVNAALAPYIAQEERLAQLRAKSAESVAAETAAIEKARAEYNALTGAANQKNTALDKQTRAHKDGKQAAEGHAGGIHSMWSQSFLFFGIAMGVNSAIQQFSAATGEKANPNLVQFGRIMQEVSSGAMVGMMSGLGPMGMGIGAVAGLLLGMGIAATTVDPQISELNKRLDSLAKKDDVVEGLMKVVGVSKEVAEALLEVAKASPRAAQAMRDYVDSTKEVSGVEAFFGAAGEGFKRFSNDVTNAYNALKPMGQGVQDLLQPLYELGQRFDLIGKAAQKFKDLRQAQADQAATEFNAAQAATAIDTAHKQLVEQLEKTSTKNAASQLAELAGVTRNTAKEFLDLAVKDEALSTRTSNLVNSILSAQKALLLLDPALASDAAFVDTLNKNIAVQEAELQILVNGIENWTDWVKTNNGALLDEELALQRNSKAQRGLGSDIGTVDIKIAEQARKFNEAQLAAKEYGDAVDAASQKILKYMQSAVTQAVDTSIKPTTVSAEDQHRNDLIAERAKLYNKANEAEAQGKSGLRNQVNSRIDAINAELAVLGPYEEKWDELARQSDIIKNDGVKRLAEFPKLSAALQQTGLDAKKFGEDFRSNALFADFKPEDFMGGEVVDRLAQDAMGKLKETIGRQNLSDAVSKEVWKDMPEGMRDALTQMGITNLSDAEKIKLGIRKDPAFDSVLQELKAQILNNFPPTLYSTVLLKYEIDSGRTSGTTSDAYKKMKDAQLEGRAAGGPVSAGVPYLMGERGPEIYVPSASGYVYPNNAIGGDVVINFSGTPPKDELSMRQLARELAREIRQAR